MTMDQYEASLSTRIISEREDNIKTRKDVAWYRRGSRVRARAGERLVL